MKKIIFACVHNAGRSQMAAAFFNSMVQPSVARAISAGTEPAAKVHPEVVAAMKELGLDLGGARPQLLTAELASNADLLITMGCGENCPFVPGLRVEEWAIPDPKGQPPERVREIREAVRQSVAKLVASLAKS